MAGMLSSAARWIRSSGSDATYRKLKALAAWSSTYPSVIQCLHLPMSLRKITCQPAAEPACIMTPGDQVPLFERPEGRLPPVSGCRPGPVSTLDGISLLPEDERVRLPITYGDDD